jgi:hypothetical protein
VDGDTKRLIIDIHLAEFQKLKDEQVARIAFRDNLIYVTLGVFGAIMSFAITEKSRYPALLVLPLVSLVLGWTYLVNDEKVSAIGRYIRHDLGDRMAALFAPGDTHAFFGWEIAHRDDRHRKARKRRQFVVDELTFVGSGAVGLGTYCILEPGPSWHSCVVFALGVVMLVSIAVDIFRFADFAKGR